MKDQKKVFDHTRAGNGGVRAIAKRKKIFGVSHKELKSHVSRGPTKYRKDFKFFVILCYGMIPSPLLFFAVFSTPI